MREKQIKGAMLYIFIFFIIFAAVSWGNYINNNVQDQYNYNKFMEDLALGKVDNIIVQQNKEVPTGKLKFKVDGKEKELFVPDVNEVILELKQSPNTSWVVKDIKHDSFLLTTLIPYLLIFGGLILLFFFMTNQSQNGGGAGKAMSFGKSRARMATESDKKLTLKDVAGLQEEKEELAEIVDFLKSPKKYIEVGARIPKGVILVGPPGTGKTLLGKAVAGEAGVPFFSISGSDFVEMFVGVGASRVRDLFLEAKKNSPCIIFIDEIDAVARRRGTGMGGGHDEREQTLNQLLVEMDGFGVNEGIIVMAATNRVDILDPAILRPGRFDRKIMVGKPDVKGRKEILKVHSKGKPLAEDVDLDKIAQTTPGFSGADIENLLNESAIYAARNNRKYIIQSDILTSFVKVGVGTEKRSKVIPEKEKCITAYHEAGHAILFHILPDVGPVHSVSIIPTGAAAGYTMPIPEQDNVFNTKSKMKQEIVVSMGGRIAESLILDNDFTTGASQDIKSATETARAMVMKYGMSETLGPINYANSEEVFIGRDMAQTRAYSETIAAKIDEEVKSIVDECYTEAKRIITENIDILEKCSKLLIEREKIGREEFEALFLKESAELEIQSHEFNEF